jgi:hypothetical protein
MLVFLRLAFFLTNHLPFFTQQISNLKWNPQNFLLQFFLIRQKNLINTEISVTSRTSWSSLSRSQGQKVQSRSTTTKKQQASSATKSNFKGVKKVTE